MGFSSCRKSVPWDLSKAQSSNCAHEGLVMPICANSSHCPGICVTHKSGSTFFKFAMHRELRRHGTRLKYETGCTNVHCARFPWPPWRAPERVIRIVRHPETRLLSAYLQKKHLKYRPPGFTFPPNASFEYVVRRVTSLPDLLVNPHLRRQAVMCARPPLVPQIVLRLEEYATWRAWLLKELQWSYDALPESPNAPSTSPERVDEYYTPELKALVARWAVIDLQEFGYV